MSVGDVMTVIYHAIIPTMSSCVGLVAVMCDNTSYK